jgi:hypothetical protein
MRKAIVQPATVSAVTGAHSSFTIADRGSSRRTSPNALAYTPPKAEVRVPKTKLKQGEKFEPNVIHHCFTRNCGRFSNPWVHDAAPLAVGP